MADSPKKSVARAPLLALAEQIAAECRGDHALAEAYDLKLRVWEAGTRFEDWRLIVVWRASRREHQVRCWADWELLKQRELAASARPVVGGVAAAPSTSSSAHERVS